MNRERRVSGHFRETEPRKKAYSSKFSMSLDGRRMVCMLFDDLCLLDDFLI
jgi:hypothetical protein